VQAAATRAANLTRQLLIFSRKEVVQPQQLNLMVVFKELRPLLRRLIGTHIDFQWNVPEKLAPIMADPANFEQIIVNLVINARDAMPDGGRIEIAAKNCTLEKGSPVLDVDAGPGNYVEVSVTDTGTGISKEILSRIFEPFFTTKEAGKGTGLGLSTVHSIVRQQHGWIRVKSALGAGTTFTVYHPVMDAPSSSEDRDSSADDAARNGHDEYRNVLVVEDDPTVKALLSNIFKRHNIRHTLAADGVIAQEMWRTANPPFDLLVTDIVMPNGVNGIRLARTLREQNPDLGVVLTSGFSELLFDSANLQMPGSPPKVLQKPFSPDDLLAAMSEACISPLA
jgi:CheY-like chemotaxis protein/anti-sigma regulatory factor (Ser/Thr protein kinase)